MYRNPVKNVKSVSMRLPLSTGHHLLGVQSVTDLKSHLCTTLTRQPSVVNIFDCDQWTGQSGAPMPVGETVIFSSKSRRTLGPTQSPIQWMLGVKQSRREINYSPASGTEVKNKWIYTSTPPIRFHGVQKENFTFFPTT